MFYTQVVIGNTKIKTPEINPEFFFDDLRLELD